MADTKRIAVAGKGGTGKTTLAALTVLELVRRGKGPVLAIDADPDSNLGTLLGIEPKQSIGDLRDEVRKEIANFPPGMTKANYFEAGMHQVIEEAEGFDLITMGKGEGSGCYCYLNSLIRKFYEDLTPGYPWVVMDNEAGLEHISRRTSANIDSLITVVNANPISFSTAEKIDELVSKLSNQVHKKYVVTNMIPKERTGDVKKRLEKLDMEHLCDLPRDPELEGLIFNGRSLRDLKDSPLRECIDTIIDQLGG